MPAIGLTDHNLLTGVIELVMACKEAGIQSGLDGFHKFSCASGVNEATASILRKDTCSRRFLGSDANSRASVRAWIDTSHS